MTSVTSGRGVGHAAGTFETPPGGGTVTVDGLGFEPDLLLFTATNNVTADGPALDRTDGWTYGTAKRESDGTVNQQAVSVANDARQTDAGIAAATPGQVVDLLIHDDERANGLLGAVEATTSNGFEIAFDASALPEHHADDSYVVMFRAFETDKETDVDTGFFQTPSEVAVQTTELETDADYVALTAVEPLEEMDAAQVTGGRLGLSHGVAAMEASLGQHVITGCVDSTPVGHNSYAAYDDRAIHLLHGAGDEIAGRTSARVTDLGEQLELTYDAVNAPDGDTVSEEAGTDDETGARDDQDADGERAGAPPRLVTYVAVDTGDGPAPALGEFELPAQDDAFERIDTGFEPEVIDFTIGTADGVGNERTVAASPLSFGWSHGTATIDRSGAVDHYVLHSSVDGRHATGSGPLSTPVTRSEAGEIGGVAPPGVATAGLGPAGTAPGAGLATDTAPDDRSPGGGSSDVPPSEDDEGDASGGRTPGSDDARGSSPADHPASAGAGALGYVLDAAGRVRRRDAVRVTGVDRTGFAVETRQLGDDTTAEAGLRRPVVFYTAWPRSDQ